MDVGRRVVVRLCDAVEQLLPHLADIEIEEMRFGAEVLLTAKVRGDEGMCPARSKPSSRVHSRYRRTLTDAAVAGQLIRILLTVRRFFCDNPECQSKTFAEQVDGLTRRWSRVSEGARRMLTAIGLALAGRAGARLSTALGMPASRHRLLRLVRTARPSRRRDFGARGG